MENVLVGKVLTGIKLAEDKGAILFEADEERIIARADGDCCSNTWIESIELPAMGFPAKVLSTEDLNLNKADEGEDEVIAFYGFKISTDKGDVVIDYRNSSNGYYGGNLSWNEDDHYGGVYGQNNSNEKWQEIK